MDDVLERMLAVEKQGNAVIKDAEELAVKLREEASARLAAEKADFSAALAQECASIESAAVASAEAQRETELAAARNELPGRLQKFSSALSGQRSALLERLMGLS